MIQHLYHIFRGLFEGVDRPIELKKGSIGTVNKIGSANKFIACALARLFWALSFSRALLSSRAINDYSQTYSMALSETISSCAPTNRPTERWKNIFVHEIVIETLERQHMCYKS
jgi:hypothetical protein